MRFSRKIRILNGQPDYAGLACVLLILVMFMKLAPSTFTSGLRVQLPLSGELPGSDKPTVNVAVDAKGKLFYRNEELTEAALGIRLAAAVTNAGEPITLVIQADKSVPNERLIQLGTLARKAGIHDAVLATLPRLVDAPAAPSKQ